MANKPIGTGPYTIASWNRGDAITLTRNDSYWGAKPYYQTVVLKYFKDATALNNALLTGADGHRHGLAGPGGQLALGQFRRSQNLSGMRLPEGRSLVLVRQCVLDKPFGKGGGEVFASEAVIAGAGPDLHDTFKQIKQRDIEGAAAQIEDEELAFAVGLVQAVSHRGGGRLVQ